MTDGTPAPEPVPAPTRFRVWLALVTLVGLGLRLAYIAASRVPRLPLRYGDSRFYHTAANLLTGGRGFIEPVALPRSVESATHPPLYLVWLAIPSYLWPGHTATPTVHILWSCVLGVATIVVCGLAGREIAGPRVGLIAAALAALYPNFWFYEGLVLSETMALLTSAGVILFAYRFLHRPSGRAAVWLGVWCGLAALARSELLLTVPLLLAPLVLGARGIDWSRRLRWLAVGGVATAVFLAPWVLYNRSRFAEPVLLSTNLGGTLAAANCDEMYFGDDIGFRSYPCGSRTYHAASLKTPHWRARDESEVDAAVQGEALGYVRAHFGRLPLVVAARLGRVAGVFQPFREVRLDQFVFSEEPWLAYLRIYSYWLVAALAVVGGVLLRRRRTVVWPLLAIPVIVLLSVAITFGQTRYRAPAEPALAILAAVSLDAVWSRWRRTAAAQIER